MKVLVTLVVALVAMELVACREIKEADQRKELQKKASAFLKQFGSFDKSFSPRQIRLLRKGYRPVSAACSFKNQRTFEEAARRLNVEPAESYLKETIERQTEFCKAHERTSDSKAYHAIVEQPALGEALFGVQHELSTRDVITSDRISANLDKIDSEEAEYLLTRSGRSLSAKVVRALLRKLDANRYSFALGKLGELVRISGEEFEENKCHKNDLEYIYSKAMQFSKKKFAIALFVQNLAYKQNKVCGSDKSAEALKQN